MQFNQTSNDDARLYFLKGKSAYSKHLRTLSYDELIERMVHDQEDHMQNPQSSALTKEKIMSELIGAIHSPDQNGPDFILNKIPGDAKSQSTSFNGKTDYGFVKLNGRGVFSNKSNNDDLETLRGTYYLWDGSHEGRLIASLMCKIDGRFMDILKAKNKKKIGNSLDVSLNDFVMQPDLELVYLISEEDLATLRDENLTKQADGREVQVAHTLNDIMTRDLLDTVMALRNGTSNRVLMEMQMTPKQLAEHRRKRRNEQTAAWRRKQKEARDQKNMYHAMLMVPGVDLMKCPRISDYVTEAEYLLGDYRQIIIDRFLRIAA